MMYPYLELSDGTQVVHSQIIEEDGEKKVFVNFERAVDGGFDDARCELPSYRWMANRGYSKEELAHFQKFLKNNAHLIYRFAAEGGLKFA